MERIGWRGVVASVACGLAATVAQAGPAPVEREWATWVATSSTIATGSFEDGTEITFSGFVDGLSGTGDSFLATPSIPGVPGGGNPPGVNAVTGSPHPGVLDPGGFIMSIDFSDVPPGTPKVFAMSDMLCCRSYRLELLDAAFEDLPLGGVTVTDYNLAIPVTPPVQFVADFDVTLNPTSGALRVFNVHDSGASDYNHTGFTEFANLPAEARFLRVTSDSLGQQATEGVHFYFAIEAPEAGAGAGGATAILALLAPRRRASR